MRMAGLVLFAILLSGISSAAQEQSLGDIARAARNRKSEASHPAKIITNDELSGAPAEPVKATDDPAQVVSKARTALLRDTLHVCRSESAGNSGPGWVDSRFVEVGAADRKHFLSINRLPNDPNGERIEYIAIADKMYMKTGNGAWIRSGQSGWDERRLTLLLDSSAMPQALGFRFDAGTLKLIRTDTVDGGPAFLYQYSARTYDLDRTISIWIGANNGRLLRSEMQTAQRDSTGLGSSWKETATCSYGGNVNIEAPM